MRAQQQQQQQARSQRCAAAADASAAIAAAAAASAARLSREAELEERMLRQQQEALASDRWEPRDWRWRPLVQGTSNGGDDAGGGSKNANDADDATSAGATAAEDAEAEAAVAAYARAADDLEAPLRGLRLLMPPPQSGSNDSPLALLAFLRRGLDEACARALEEDPGEEDDGGESDDKAAAAATTVEKQPPKRTARILVLGGGAPLALAAAAAAKQAGWPACSVVLVEPSPWGRRAARDLLLAAAATADDAGDAAGTSSTPSCSFAVVASPAQATEVDGWKSGPRGPSAAHVAVTDLFASGAIALPSKPPRGGGGDDASKAASSSCGAGGSPFALGLLGALRAASRCGAINRASTALVPAVLRLYAALASGPLTPEPAVTRGVDLSPAIDRAYGWAPPGSGGFVAQSGGRVSVLSEPFLAAEVELCRVAVDTASAATAAPLASKTTRVEAAAEGGCSACLVWVEPVLAGVIGSLPPPLPPSSLPPRSAALWLPPHRPLPLLKGDALLVRATVAAGRSAALALEFSDADDEDDDDHDKEENNERAIVACPTAPPPPPLDRPRRGALLPSWHLEMVSDAARNAAYDQAIRRAVEKVDLESSGGGKVPLPPPPRVLDVGAGTALLSVLAAR